MSEGKRKVLIVDDEPGIRDSLKLLLKQNFEIGTAQDGMEALELIEEFKPDLILLDVIMPKLDGLETLKQIRDKSATLPVIMLTATNTVKTAVQAMKFGAVDYLNKPFDIEELKNVIGIAIEQQEVITKARASVPVVRVPAPKGDFGPMVGRSPLMQDLFQRIEQIAARDTTVVVTGESGTGKELIARHLHDLSPRKDGPFVAINCAAIPETLIESELFGHEKGAFTHAIERRIGHFELANSGTLFLDEIGELSLSVQVKMLRFLQEQEFYRVGRSKSIKVDVRIVAATNRNLEELVREKKFRQDLYYRINVISLHVPPLRDRFEDIPSLVEHFVKKYQPLYGNKALSFTTEALNVLVEYSWPGNVRELENTLESLMALSQQDEVTEPALPPKLKQRSEQDSLKFSAPSSGLKFDEAERLFETEMILKALKKTNYVQTRAAELLGISRRILKYKMDKLGIKDTPENIEGLMPEEEGDEPLPASDETIS